MSSDDTPGIDRRTLAGLTFGVVVASALVATGFTALSSNPLTPDATLTVADADDEYNLSESGHVRLITVSHVEGEPIPVSELQIVFGSRSDGLTFSAAKNWTLRVGDMRYRTFLDEQVLRNDTASQTLDHGEALYVTKTSGRIRDPPQNATTTIRVFHEPSEKVIARKDVTMR